MTNNFYSECCDADPDEFVSLNFHFPAMPSGLCDNCKEHTTFYVLVYNEQRRKDSRHFGPISYDQILGKLIFRYYPFNSIRFF